MIIHTSTVYYAARDRYLGFQDALREAGIEKRKEWVKVGDFTEESGYHAMEELLSAPELPTAVFAGNDMIAYGAVKAVKDAGLRIPEDISIGGFDDDFLSRYLNPPLTTMSLPAASLGAEAARLIVDAIKGSEIQERQIILSPHLSIRESCRPLPG
jgi:LacI family transcriptional regulator